MTSTHYLDRALRCVGAARIDNGDKIFWIVADSELRKAIGAFNRERNRKGAGLALLALAKVRAQIAA